MTEHPIKKKVQEAYTIADAEAKDLYQAIGAALTAWGKVEQALCDTYILCVVPQAAAPYAAAGASFWSVATFEGKLKMTEAAVTIWLREVPELSACWERTTIKLREKSKLRNKLAHGIVCRIWTGLISLSPS
jgi:hypothetical protein